MSGDVRFARVIRTTNKLFLFMKIKIKEKSFSKYGFRNDDTDSNDAVGLARFARNSAETVHIHKIFTLGN